MTDEILCRTCGSKLIKRETRRKASQFKQAYYYTAYYFCPSCQKIYHDDKFKVINDVSDQLFDTGVGAEGSGKGRAAVNGLTDGHNAVERMKFDVEIWTDGACVFNGRANARAAWAFVSDATEKAGLVPGAKQTNNVAEGLAILHALEWAVENNFKRIKVHTDSQISINNLLKPSHMIKQNAEIFVKVEELIEQNGLTVHFEKVLGHSGDVNNTRADKLANGLAGNR